MSVTIYESDILFGDSPYTGEVSCICSRCANRIKECEMPLRCWPDDLDDYSFSKQQRETYLATKGKGGCEFRYCEECQSQMGIHYSKTYIDHSPNFDNN